jgi:hypothetical protein
VPGTRAQLPDSAGVGAGDGLPVTTGAVGCGVGLGVRGATVGGRVVLGGVLAGVAGAVSSAGADALGSGVGVGVGEALGAVVVAGAPVVGAADRALGDGLTMATPCVDGGRDVPADSTSQIVTAIALSPSTRSTRLLNELPRGPVTAAVQMCDQRSSTRVLGRHA